MQDAPIGVEDIFENSTVATPVVSGKGQYSRAYSGGGRCRFVRHFPAAATN